MARKTRRYGYKLSWAEAMFICGEDRLRRAAIGSSSRLGNWKADGVPSNILAPILLGMIQERSVPLAIKEPDAFYNTVAIHLRQIQQRIERLFRRTEGRDKEWTALERLLDLFEPPVSREAEERERYWKKWRVVKGGKR